MQGDPVAVGTQPLPGLGQPVFGAVQADGQPQRGPSLQRGLQQLPYAAAQIDQHLGLARDLVQYPVPVVHLPQLAGVRVARQRAGLDLDG